MFIIPRDSDVHRRPKVYSNSKAIRSSKTSLLSTFTVATSGSGGSSSTITQESYNRSHRHRRRKTKEHRSRKHHDDGKNRSVDVFDFLVEDNTRSKESLSADQNHEAENSLGQGIDDAIEDVGRPAPENHDDHHDNVETLDDSSEDDDESDSDPSITLPTPAETKPISEEDQQSPHPLCDSTEIEDPDPEGYYRSMSDSGISMGSGGSFQPPLPVLHEEAYSRPNSPSKHTNQLALIDPRWHWPGLSPQPPMDRSVPPPCPQPPPAVMYDVPMYAPYPYPHPPYTPYGTPPPPIPEPYIREVLAVREPAGQRTKPNCFRSFNRISTRLVLQMQDDIADLEEELKQIDEEIGVAEHDSDNSSSSSRSVIRELKLREQEIYRELLAQIDQYYHALEMMQKMDDISLPATKSDLPKHHRWLESRILQPERVRRLISNDLRKFGTRNKPVEIVTTRDRSFQPRYLAYTALINGVLPLVMFKMINGVLNRLIILLTVIIVGCMVQGRAGIVIGKDELTCTLVCVCISAFAAIFL